MYLVPLMIGARDRLPAHECVRLLDLRDGRRFPVPELLRSRGAELGLVCDVPLSSADYALDKGADIWAQMITFTEVSSMLVASSGSTSSGAAGIPRST